eukprot:TRINITY_DN1753_c0_g1_i1.p1 TRINITY_DN1753_c0_g1~~TRINITY_DN1753_c0_g1_i1.p1  ORF type:complete len:132 (+),score=35.44 TRINITY_DN1753_c0_g1_i1:59-454(+)
MNSLPQTNFTSAPDLIGLKDEKSQKATKKKKKLEDDDDEDAPIEVKKQKRLEKNREAAQQFRQRQREYISELESKVQGLNTTNSEFRSRLDDLDKENKLLKDQLAYLRNFIGKAVTFAYPADGASNNNKGS